MRNRNRSRLLLAATTLSLGLTACGSHGIGAARTAALGAVAASLQSSYDFTFSDTDLVGNETISGQVADSYRYQMLLSVDSQPVWQEVVRDDAVADFFPQSAALTTFAGTGYAPEDDLGTTFAQLSSLLPPGERQALTTIYALAKLRHVAAPTDLATASLAAGKWVVDPTGAPALATLAAQTQAERSDPFYEPMVILEQVQSYLLTAPNTEVTRFRPDSTTPAFKPGDDPFPAPPAGETRYDIAEPSLPGPSLGSLNGLPPPPTNSSFRKVAIYVRHGRVVAVRVDYDILDRLARLADAYHIPLHINRAAGVALEEGAGQLLVDSLQSHDQTPFRVHEDTMLITYPNQAPEITLPSPAVRTSLTGALPGQGSSGATTSF